MKTANKWMILTVVALLAGPAYAGREMSVQVREGELRNRASFLGAVVAVVEYGARVAIEREQGPWRFVRLDDVEGWIHESALTRRRIEWQAGDSDLSGAATEDELALAGRGFNAEVEGEFKSRNEDIDFTWVDYMEGLRKSPAEITEFLRRGGVVPLEGDE